ncbi:MAG: Na+/H+ antiporter subunit E [Burkholderiales bacterium]|nr:Na+/H+ antiporter subunit E [Burkholderiales bacterium]
MNRWIPQPLVSVAVFATWLLLNGSFAPGQLLLGLALAVAIPLATRRVSAPEPLRIRRPAAIVRLAGVVLHDIVVSNLDVARRVLGPESAIRPGFVRVPLDLVDTHAIAALAGIVTMTPGTLSAEVSPDRSHLIVHALHIDDPETIIATIKSRYETPLKEICA